jgi:hypothetical protein
VAWLDHFSVGSGGGKRIEIFIPTTGHRSAPRLIPLFVLIFYKIAINFQTFYKVTVDFSIVSKIFFLQKFELNFYFTENQAFSGTSKVVHQ